MINKIRSILTVIIIVSTALALLIVANYFIWQAPLIMAAPLSVSASSIILYAALLAVQQAQA